MNKKLVLGALFAAVPTAFAQQFEAASVKVATSGVNGVRGGCHGVDSTYTASEVTQGIPPLGRCVITDARLSHLIGIAYGVTMQTLDTGPDWIQRGDLRFNVEAKAENTATATRQQLLTMLQNLLVERFHIKFHYVTKEEPGFAMTVAKGGPKLRASTADEPKLSFLGPHGEAIGKPMGNSGGLNAQMCSMQCLKDVVTFVGSLGPGVDRTGLTGVYDFTIKWNEDDGPSIGTALREQLGLEVKSEKIPVSRFVLDSAEKPTPN